MVVFLPSATPLTVSYMHLWQCRVWACSKAPVGPEQLTLAASTELGHALSS